MAEFNYPHIGKKIAEVLRQKSRTMKSIAEAMNRHPSTVIDMLRRQSINTEALHKVSLSLQHNFFQYYPLEEEGEKNKEVADLKARIAELEKQLEQHKSENENLKKENGYVKEINDLLRKK